MRAVVAVTGGEAASHGTGSSGRRRLGVEAGKAFRDQLFKGNGWNPLKAHPEKVTRVARNSGLQRPHSHPLLPQDGCHTLKWACFLHSLSGVVVGTLVGGGGQPEKGLFPDDKKTKGSKRQPPHPHPLHTAVSASLTRVCLALASVSLSHCLVWGSMPRQLCRLNSVAGWCPGGQQEPGVVGGK